MVKDFRPTASYSAEADAIYVRLRPGVIVRSRPLDDFRILDLGEDDAVVGVEFINVSQGVDLSGIPFRDLVAKLIGDLRLGVKVYA